MEQEQGELIRLIYEAHQQVLLYRKEFEKESCNARFKYLREQDEILLKSDGRSRKRLYVPKAHEISKIPLDIEKINDTIRHKFYLSLAEGFSGGEGMLDLLYNLACYISEENGKEDLNKRNSNEPIRRMLMNLRGVYTSLFPENDLEALIKEHHVKVTKNPEAEYHVNPFLKNKF
tara:strand:- start:1510 stop:2034 length:525 start_codon:yes stop_codon:yes gene_type:complete